METKQHKKGTTTVGVLCKDAVILAADQLSTLGDFKMDLNKKKIFSIAKNIAMTTAGNVGDNQAILRVIGAQMRLYELDIGQPTVKAAITLLSNMLSDKYLYSYLPYGLFNIIAGFDTQPRMYSIDPIGGFSEADKFVATGSGMTLAYSILDADFKENLSADDAIKLAVKSIVAARKRVSSVGGDNITVLKIDAKGITEIAPNKVLAIAKAY
jgi:proteasome beta subunit